MDLFSFCDKTSQLHVMFAQYIGRCLVRALECILSRVEGFLEFSSGC